MIGPSLTGEWSRDNGTHPCLISAPGVLHGWTCHIYAENNSTEAAGQHRACLILLLYPHTYNMAEDGNCRLWKPTWRYIICSSQVGNISCTIPCSCCFLWVSALAKWGPPQMPFYTFPNTRWSWTLVDVRWTSTVATIILHFGCVDASLEKERHLLPGKWFKYQEPEQPD